MTGSVWLYVASVSFFLLLLEMIPE